MNQRIVNLPESYSFRAQVVKEMGMFFRNLIQPGWAVKTKIMKSILITALIICSSSMLFAQDVPAGDAARPAGKTKKQGAEKKGDGMGSAADEAVIRSILDHQTSAWNRGSLEEFMQGYWKNDSLMFIGKSGVTYGWTNTLENYRKGYPDTSAMGQLHFDIIRVRTLSKKYAEVIGRWTLKRSAGDLTGHFSLLFRKIDGEWVIVSDHSS
jgi:hypothetical protein